MSDVASKAKSMAKSVIGSVTIPKLGGESSFGAGLATPKTPADEGIQFFEHAVPDKSKPIAVYEIHLNADGGPNKERSVSGMTNRSRTHSHPTTSSISQFVTNAC